jgi:drug/metabolite transporter (DMT)-like permease
MQHETGRPVLAALLVLGAMALFGLIDNFMRLAAETGGLWQFHFLRAIVALVILAPLAWMLGATLRPRAPGRVLLRSTLNSVAMVIYFGCLGFMPIAQVVAGLFTAPIFVVLFSVLLFGERIGPRRILAVALGFVGIILALRPEAGDLSLLSAVPVLAGALYGLGNLVTRRWLGDEGTLALLGGFFGMMMVWGALGCLFLLLWPLPVPAGAEGWATRGWVAPEGLFLVMIIVQGVGSLLGVGLSIKAYQLADATMVAVFENTLLVFATLWAFILWGEAPDALGLAGLALITAAGVIIALRTDPDPVENRVGT